MAGGDNDCDNDGVWPSHLRHIYVLSIRPARYASMMKRLGPILSLRVQPVIGVSGATLSMDKLRREGTYAKKYADLSMTRGAVGCFLSHVRAWEALVRSGEAHALVLEDDANMPVTPRFAARLKAAIADLDKSVPEWGVLLLGRGTNSRAVSRVSPGVVRVCKSWGLFSYIISRAAAIDLLSKWRPMYRPVDTWVTGQFACYAMDPNPFYVVKVVSDTRGIK